MDPSQYFWKAEVVRKKQGVDRYASVCAAVRRVIDAAAALDLKEATFDAAAENVTMPQECEDMIVKTLYNLGYDAVGKSGTIQISWAGEV